MATDNDSRMALLAGFSAARPLVIGDVMLDRYVHGTVERISPEAPIPVMAVQRVTEMPGGAGNVVRNIAAMGSEAVLVGVVGGDAWGEVLAGQLARVPGLRKRLVVDAARPTTVKTRYVAGSQQVLRADHESCESLAAEVEARVLEQFELAWPGADVVVLSDYAKGTLSPSLVATVVARARAAGKIVIADPKSRSFAKYRGVSVLTPNQHELELACGARCDSDEDVARLARRVIDEQVCEAMVVTRGRQGLSVIGSGGEVVHVRTTAREVYDVSGAGDTVAALLALGLAAGGSLEEAAVVANFAAGVVVGKAGTAVVTPSELVMAIRPIGAVGEHKMYSQEQVAHLVQTWRQQGLRVAFTNGCFDLVHPGHISLLDQARRTADRLVVGLNADQSVRRLKGPERPVQDEIARATVLASLKSVDAVVIFAEDTPYALIEALRPDVLVKGKDYTLDRVVGADLVASRGGSVVLVDFVAGHSTTNTLRRVTGS